jgi:RHS repeat-associated protein
MIVGIVMLLAIVLLISKPRESEAESLLSYAKAIVEGEEIETKQYSEIKTYLQSSEKNSQHDFLAGVTAYAKEDYRTAVKEFTSAAEKIQEQDDDFIKIYTYVLLNESLQYDEGEIEDFAENSRKALHYMAQSKEYRNNVDLCWRIASIFLENQEDNKQGARLLEEYVINVKGLKAESKVRLYGNIGQLYSIAGDYSAALQYCWRGLEFLESSPLIPNHSKYMSKFFAVLGDNAYGLEQYQAAIEYYEQSLEIFRKREDDHLVADASLALVNEGTAYLELGQHKKVLSVLEELDELIPKLPEAQKDDIQILRGNLRAQLYIDEGNLEQAEYELETAKELLNTDDVEYSLNKDVYLDYSYARWYKEQGRFDEALELYQQIVRCSADAGLGLEKNAYSDMADIYMQENNTDAYIATREQYVKVIELKNQQLSTDYIEYSEKIHQYYSLTEQHQIRKIITVISVIGIIILADIVFLLIKWRKKSYTDHMSRLYNREYLTGYMKKNKKKLAGKPLSLLMIDIDYFKQYAYTLSGQLAKVTDALGNETEYRYDVCDRLIEIRQYGAEGILKEDTEVSGMDAKLLEAERQNGRKRLCQITRYTRDLRGQVTETVDALGQKETYTYDKKGQLLGKLDKEGYLTKYAYTKQGDLSGIQYADGKEVKLSYNPLRQLIEIQDWLGSTRITPDALGRAEKVQYPDGREVSYTYGKAGERRSITYPDGKTVFYGYDEQFRLSELKEGGRIITYGYDTVGRLCEKQFPNGTKTTYRYDRKDQLTELLHQDQEGILDRYTYLYDLLGNKTGITKERRGLERESGQYRYGYDALGRLSEIQKDGEIQTQYGYDAFGNRTWKEERGEQTSYQYNALNQLVSERQGEIRKEYGYDKRGNLTAILENGAWKKRYVYGAMNRLEEAVDAAGKQARYQYNGLGHRVGKQEGVLPKEKLEKLDPQRRVGMEIGNSRQITYTLDLTRQYYNLLERTEESQSQRYFWDGNVAAYEENGERNYYLQDELGSPLRLEDSVGTIKENYGYGAFGEDLYQNQGKIQPFGYTGYQRDEIAGTYYAQAREYLAENGRFAGQDLIVGFIEYPETLNRYGYCWDNPFKYVDYDGEFPTIIAGAGIGFLVSGISSIVTQVVLDRKVNWKETFVDTVGGAIKGGIAGSGIGIVGGVLATGATGAATSVASQIYADDKKMNEVDWRSVVIAGGIDAVTYGTGKYKIKGKGPTVQEQLRKTNDDVYNARLYKAGYGKKRQHGKSYQRAIKKVSELKKLQRQLAKKWLNEKTTDGIKEIEGNFGKKLQEKIIILQLQIAPGINNVERCEA